jgi:KEOPS complex subunit Pcc1
VPGGTHPHASAFSVECGSVARARTVARSVSVEAGEIDDDRSTATVERDGATVRVRIEAADLVALRAGNNSWLRLLAVAESAAGCVAGTPPPDP